MKVRNLFILACLALLFSGCAQVFAPAMYHQDIAYQPKPTSFDTLMDANYISAGLNINTGAIYDDVVTSGQVNLSRGHVFNNFNLAYGAFASFGDYQNASTDKSKASYFDNKFFGAVGGRMSANAFITSGNTEFRFIGFEAAYSHEFGSYADYRQSLQKLGGYYVDARTDLLTVGLTTEVIFKTKNNNGFTHGIRGFMGTTFGYNDLYSTYYKDDTASERMFRNLFPKASYFITYKNYFGTAEVGNAIMARFGLRF